MVTKYEIKVQTGCLDYAGTDSNIKIQLFDEDNKSTASIFLDNKDNNFERGACDTFMIDADSLSNITKIKIFSDNSGKNPGWYLNWITIQNVTNEEFYAFPAYCWIEKGNLEREFDNRGSLYKVKVQTGCFDYAGTDSNIRIQLYDKDNNSTPSILLDNKDNNFEKGSCDIFYIVTDTLYDISKIQVSSNDSGKHSGWYLNWLTVQNCSNDKLFAFPAYCWIEKGRLNHELLKSGSLYEVKVQTEYRNSSGTDSNIRIQLIDEDDKSTGLILLDNNANNFETGNRDTFFIVTDTLTNIKKIKLVSDDTGKYSGWYLDWVTVKNVNLRYCSAFPGKRWIEKAQLECEIESVDFYDICIKTGDRNKAGTDSNIWIQLCNDDVNSDWIYLDDEYNNFERGDIDNFHIPFSDFPFNITKVRVKSDGSGKYAGWYLDWITVERINIHDVLFFNAERWVEEGNLQCELEESEAAVYWCARDLTYPLELISPPIGNHHFLLLETRSESLMRKIINLAKSSYDMDLEYKSEESGKNVYYFITLAGTGEFREGSLKLVCDINGSHDVKSVREKLDPNEHTKWYKPDMDLTRNLIHWLPGHDLVDEILQAVKNYMDHGDSVPDYRLSECNCATWVNTLLKCIKYTEKDREIYGEHFGVDWGEEDTFDDSFFESVVTQNNEIKEMSTTSSSVLV